MTRKKIVIYPAVEAFDLGQGTKAMAGKIIEEALEVFVEAKDLECDMTQEEYENRLSRMVAECADVIQAVSNLLAHYGIIDMGQAMCACYEKNKARGRYEGNDDHER